MQNSNCCRQATKLLYPACTAVYQFYSSYICQQCKKKYYLIVPELKKGQILHLSAGVTLRLYSGNRVWKEVYSHKRAMFRNQIKRRYSWVFLNFVFRTVFVSNSPYQRQDTNEEVRALTTTWNSNGKYLIWSSSFATLCAIYLLGTNIWK